MTEHTEHCPHKGFLKWFLSWRGVVLTLALAAISYYLMTVHREHVALVLPYLFLLSCPLMHMFGHGHHHHEETTDRKE
jgi:hypothetical protein